MRHYNSFVSKLGRINIGFLIFETRRDFTCCNNMLKQTILGILGWIIITSALTSVEKHLFWTLGVLFRGNTIIWCSLYVAGSRSRRTSISYVHKTYIRSATHFFLQIEDKSRIQKEYGLSFHFVSFPLIFSKWTRSYTKFEFCRN